MNPANPIVIVLAVIAAIVLLGIVLKIALTLIGLALILAVGVAIYFFVAGATGKSR